MNERVSDGSNSGCARRHRTCSSKRSSTLYGVGASYRKVATTVLHVLLTRSSGTAGGSHSQRDRNMRFRRKHWSDMRHARGCLL